MKKSNKYLKKIIEIIQCKYNSIISVTGIDVYMCIYS